MGKLLESMRKPGGFLPESRLDDRPPAGLIREVRDVPIELSYDRVYDPIPPRSKGIELPSRNIMDWLRGK